MNKQEQVRFVEELVDYIRADVVSKIEAGQTPETWDGHELRVLVAARFAQSADRSRKGTLKGQRGHDFKNHCLVNNLL